MIILFFALFVSSALLAQNEIDGGKWWNTDYNNNEGTDFWVTYMFNSGNLKDDGIDLKLRLYATAREETTITVYYANGSSQSVRVPAYGRSEFIDVDLNNAYVVNPREVIDKGLHVTADKKVALYAVSQNSQLGSQDATVVWPTDALYKEYMIQTYGTDGIATEFAIVATRDIPECTIYIKETFTPKDSIVEQSDTTLVGLKAGDVFLMRSRGGEYSLSGTYICSDEPIAVFVGGQYAEVPEKSDPKNHLYAQSMPTDKLGKKFVVPSSIWMKFDFVRLTAVIDNTVIQRDDKVIATLNKGETYQDTIYNSSKYDPFAVYYSSNNDLIVHQYLTSYAINGDTTGYNQNTGKWQITQSDYGAPALAPITPLEYGMHSVIFATFDSPNIEARMVNIVVERQGVSSIQLDGQNISGEFSVCQGNPNYYYAQVKLNEATSHIITCNTGTFVATIYGYGQNGTRYESYAYSGGSSILHPAWMLIDGQRINSKTICIKDNVNFKSVVNYDHDNVNWKFINTDTHEYLEFDTIDVLHHQFPDTGRWEINMIVERITPLCVNSIQDTIKAIILVQDTFYVKATEQNGNLRIVCQSDVSDTPVAGKTYQYRTSDLQLNVWNTYYDSLLTVAGCDSICEIKVLVGEEYTNQESKTICENEFPWNWTLKDSHGTHTKTIDRSDFPDLIDPSAIRSFDYPLSTVYGCDSVITLKLTVYKVDRDTVRDTICADQQPYLWVDGNGRKVKELDYLLPDYYEFSDTIKLGSGCDDIRVLQLLVTPTYEIEHDTTICQGESLLWEDTLLTTSGVYTRKYITKEFGCDSIMKLHLQVGKTYVVDSSVVLCERDLPWSFTISDTHGDTQTFSCSIEDLLDGELYEREFSYTLHTISPFECDSVINIHLRVAPSSVREQDVLWCRSGGAYTFDHSSKQGGYTESGTYRDTLDIPNQFGCDSVVVLNLEILETIQTSFDVDLCDAGVYNYEDDPSITEWQNLTQSGDYSHTFESVNGCDSIVTLHLFIRQPSRYTDNVYVCDNELPYRDVDFPNIFSRKDTSYVKILKGGNQYGCDSIVTVNVYVGKTYITEIPVEICERDLPWSYPISDTNGNTATLIYAPTRSLNGRPYRYEYKYLLHTVAPFKCDSLIKVQLTVFPTTIREDNVLWCRSAGAYTFEHSSKREGYTESGTYRDTLTIPNHYGCDSVILLNLEILESIETDFTVEWCDNDGVYNYADDPSITEWQNLTQSGDYQHTFKSVNGCDSIVTLHLVGNKHDETSEHIYICTSDLPYHDVDFEDIVFEAVNRMDTTYIKTLSNSSGCDSIVTTYVAVGEIFDIHDSFTICESNIPDWSYRVRDTHGVDITWTYPTEPLNGIPHDSLYSITLHTVEPYACDSVINVSLHINPTTFKDTTIVWCESAGPYQFEDDPYQHTQSGYYSDRLTIDNQYGCDSVVNLDLTIIQTIITRIDTIICDNEIPYNHDNTLTTMLHNLTTTGIYRDTLQSSLLNCDSIIEINLMIAPTYEVTEEVSICDNETYNFNDSIFDVAAGYYTYDTLLHTIYGCDSLVHLKLHVHPTYHFLSQATICSNETYEWRGRYYHNPGVYFDSLQTESYGCDSVYELRLIVKPAYLTEYHAGKRCDNTFYVMPDEQTGLWQDTIFFQKDTINYGYDELRDEIYTRTFFTEEGCDSIFKVHVTICPTYFTAEPNDTICSNETYLWHGKVYNLDYGEHQLDTMFSTFYGCDSAFTKKIYVKQAYHFYEYDTICDNGQLEWQHRTIQNQVAGNHQFDTTYLTFDGCDSTYTIYLTVHPTYHMSEQTIICDDETYLWQTRELTFAAGQYHFDTLYTTIHGCDSIYELDLTINPTTEETRYDTICSGETYSLPNKQVSETGYYIDTVTNQYGCNHYIHLYLEVVPPTRLTVSVDTICADEQSFEIIYHYTGTEPIEYSVIFSDKGHEQGFVDILHESINYPTDSTILILIPYGEVLPMPSKHYYDGVTHSFTSEPKRQYVEPNIYPISVYLHNAYCANDTLARAHTDALIQYPHWIHEQHWNDALVLYKDTFNGGYDFSHYQWYENGEPLEGEIGEYLYLPHNLKKDAYYQVALTRKSDGFTFMTCPITPAFDVDSIVPRLEYFSVVPTLVYTSHPYVSILCTIGGYYDVYSPTGICMASNKRFEPLYDASVLISNPQLSANVMKDDIYLDLGAGCYIMILRADNGEQRQIKIIVTDENL